MTELEKIAYAKSFIDKLANGINPLDDTPIPDNDIANNVRLSRCFFYVSDILRQVYENGGVTKPKRSPKIPFTVSLEQLERFEYSVDPIPVSEIAKRIYAMVKNENMEKVSYRQINQWLLNMGMLYLHDFGGKRPIKRPTEAGNQIGITVETKMGRYGEYQVVLYNEGAQRFILDNLDAVVATEAKKGRPYEGTMTDSEEPDD
ncbi:MAG: hypothetical protein E7606_06045 [Ruminococcaceae bacterium]|nr:hypothetical protein [Oscillospiraceae bacterium]